MLPSNLNLIIRKSVGHNNKILISNINMKIGSNRTWTKLNFTIKNPANIDDRSSLMIKSELLLFSF